MSQSEDGGPGRREIANRLFAAEFDDADFSYSESDEERAPNYVVTPSGARVNRLFLVGVLTEEEWVNDEMLRARIVDPTGAFVTYAGQYQPDALAFLERTEPPAFLAVTGKARTFEPDDGDRVFTSVRPESISEVDGDTRDRWVVEAAKRTIERTETMAAAIETGLAGEELTAALEADGVEPSLASGIALALDHYGTTPEYLDALRTLAVEALETIAGERDEVGSLDVAPDEGAGNASALAGRDLSTGDSGSEEAAEPADNTADDGPSAEFEPLDEESTTETEAVESEPVESEPTTASSDTGESETTESVTPDEPATEEPEMTASTSTDETAPADEPVGEEPEKESTGDALGDFETDEDDALGDVGDDDVEAEIEDELDDFDPEEDDVLTDEEREQVESEFGTEFSTGDEVEPEPELEPEQEPEPPSDEGSDDAEPESATEDSERESNDEPEPEPADAETTVSVDDAVLETMESLDDGDGADHDELVATVTDRTGASEAEVEDAIDDALMSGQCYEPADGKLKPI
ncbi:hypothetical protein [Halosegnis longus]|uniref:Glycerol dehydrogenase n=1 Tax=Halosegnis longus TaxID=2216012 RepID=A0AAJ4R9Y7_9EURY|nr:hypothetical protein [Halosegnis longus]RNJ26867.1 hypothetical protein Nmn1133_09355 [Salella cibi]